MTDRPENPQATNHMEPSDQKATIYRNAIQTAIEEAHKLGGPIANDVLAALADVSGDIIAAVPKAGIRKTLILAHDKALRQATKRHRRRRDNSDEPDAVITERQKRGE